MGLGCPGGIVCFQHSDVGQGHHSTFKPGLEKTNVRMVALDKIVTSMLEKVFIFSTKSINLCTWTSVFLYYIKNKYLVVVYIF